MDSPLRPPLVNKTNTGKHDGDQVTDNTLIPLAEHKRSLVVSLEGPSPRKRVKVQREETIGTDESDDEDSDDEDSLPVVIRRPRNLTTFGIMNMRMSMRPCAVSHLPSYSTRPILESYVSCNRSDMFKLHSMSNASYMSPPYACAYSHNSKRGENSLLAVTTEEGAVHVLDTSKRHEWDVEPQRCTFQPHENGVFDVQWSPDDMRLATVSADRSLCISTVSKDGITPTARFTHHTSTVKCVAWDPTRAGDVICSGSRDGMICVWDLRLGYDMKPVIVIPKSHDTERKVLPRKGKLTAPPARGVTSLLFADHGPPSLISSGSYDGILRQWDLRYIDTKRRSTRRKPTLKSVASAAHVSSDDPTLYRGTRRARGITSMSPGTGITTGLLFALSNDSRIHTYDMATLEPLSGRTTDPSLDRWSYGDENMRTNSFYVRLAISPCGRWLASGGQKDGCAYLFDVSGSSKARAHPSTCTDARGDAVELFGQKGEVGAVDWVPGSLATCADDGTVRVWRSDIGTYRRCEEDPDKMQWSWCWAREQQ
ncbi:WD40-repeat-containing domain protein [Irpex rosettiformis]|uniref:WD40-repeat-containing domain protein n=1 Tax=Irpex rosettiformis TaxID=378272 RepID=A0ACB8UBX3_9APHY|nr:WD40-repeat-containing domain protein [Irpex rosettiformis]